MENKYNLKFNRVVTNGNLILFEIENAKGEKRYTVVVSQWNFRMTPNY